MLDNSSDRSFPDHFSAVAGAYATFRPRYPDELFDWLAQLPARRTFAWDCATGSGQAARPLTRHFRRVVATDASESQIAAAEPHPQIEFRVAPASRSGLDDGSVDLVTVAQAVHWFDLPSFFEEVRRVSRPGAILAVWSYPELRVRSERIQRVLDRFYHEVVGPYWPPQRRLVEDGYRSLDFPFEEIPAPQLEIQADTTIENLAGYLGTWSATQGYRRQTGSDPVPALVEELDRSWAGSGPISVRWPLFLRVGRVHPNQTS